MIHPIIQRLIWAYVAAYAAWRAYPDETTVIPNKLLGLETCSTHGYLMPCFICAAQAQPAPVEGWLSNSTVTIASSVKA